MRISGVYLQMNGRIEQYIRIKENHERIVCGNGNYDYIKSFFIGDILDDGKECKITSIKIRHKYCGHIFTTRVSSFKKYDNFCPNCCNSYENSFAYHIEQELGEPLEKYWDFEKNTVNPYHISRYNEFKVWIKCQDTDYHGSYETLCPTFINGHKCSYCSRKKVNPRDSFGQWLKDNDLFHLWSPKNKVDPLTLNKGSNVKIFILCEEVDYHNDYGGYEISCANFVKGKRCPYCVKHKVHPKDSFAQYHINNTDKDFLTKYWSPKNTVDPWSISPSSTKKVWILCQDKEYHNDDGGYKVSCGHFTNKRRCPYCDTWASNKVHYLDSFGTKYPEKAKCWHEDNDKSPYEVAQFSTKKYKFRCNVCGNVWVNSLCNVMQGSWCHNCAISEGEKRIKVWLDSQNINYIHDKPYFNDLLSDKGNPLRPDFILPNHKVWIEYDGEFHYKDFYKDGSFELQQLHDRRKNEYAKLHGWKMIRIPYWDKENIEEILDKEYDELHTYEEI